MFGLGFGELLIILCIALLFLGPKKLPALARSLARAVHEFKKVGQDLEHKAPPLKSDSPREEIAPTEAQPISEQKNQD